jgi:uncharacterized protein (TIGR02145 family)
MNILRNYASRYVALTGIYLVFCTGCNKEINTNPVNGQSTAVFNPNTTYGSVTDVDGNIYKTVTIGTQTWMAENLRTTLYNDGSPIHHVTDSAEWANLTTGAYCNNSNDISHVGTYGRLYNFYTISTGKLCPEGWHVPTNEEWVVLNDYLGGHLIAGGHLKETGTSHWREPNTGATNSTGFTALPGGFRYSDGGFDNIGDIGYWWSATDPQTNGAHGRNMYYNYSYLYYSHYYKAAGFSVRCVKDE